MTIFDSEGLECVDDLPEQSDRIIVYRHCLLDATLCLCTDA